MTTSAEDIPSADRGIASAVIERELFAPVKTPALIGVAAAPDSLEEIASNRR